MDLKQYVKDATRTESVIDSVKVDANLLAGVVQINIASGYMLDQIKKHVFYGKEYDNQKLIEEFVNIAGSLDQIKPVLADEQTEETELAVDPRLFHAIVGIATESAELLDALMKPEVDIVNILEELGDLNWYEAIAIDAANGDFEQVLVKNIEKLKARYAEKFTSDAAINRDTDKEREILEDEDTRTDMVDGTQT